MMRAPLLNQILLKLYITQQAPCFEMKNVHLSVEHVFYLLDKKQDSSFSTESI